METNRMRTLVICIFCSVLLASANLARQQQPTPFEIRHQEVVRTFKTVTGNGFSRRLLITPESMLAVNGKAPALSQEKDAPRHEDHLQNRLTMVRTETEDFLLQQLLLVGLLKEAQPVVYIPKTAEELQKEQQERAEAIQKLRDKAVQEQKNPQTEIAMTLSPLSARSRYKTRSLTEAETRGLKQLMQGDDFVDLKVPCAHSFIGAIHADKACLDCHETHHEGDVLGAFVYEYDAGKPRRDVLKPLTFNSCSGGPAAIPALLP